MTNDIIDLTPDDYYETEPIRHDTIFDKMVYERSVNDPHYVDPAAAIKIIRNNIDERFQAFHVAMYELKREFSRDIYHLINRPRYYATREITS